MSRALHAALMPFPSPQGTQGAVAAMLRALRARGDDVALFVHPHGDGRDTELPLVRSPHLPFGTSLRSGPTFARALLDAAAVPTLAWTARGRPLFAHNVEAATAAWISRHPYAYVAHTSMANELPHYARRGAAPLSAVGRGLDALAARSAAVLSAISPKLVTELGRRFAREVRYLPIPWEVGHRPSAEERASARASARLDRSARVVGYTGNLDRYQGTELLLPMLAAIEGTSLVVATESDASRLRDDARAAGLADRLHIRPLRDEADRRHAHALFDAVVVPRTCEGGVPIKLLDALARGIPVVAAREATAGLPLGDTAHVVEATPAALAHACLVACGDVASRDTGPRYIAAHHGAGSFLDAHDAIVARLRARRRP